MIQWRCASVLYLKLPFAGIVTVCIDVGEAARLDGIGSGALGGVGRSSTGDIDGEVAFASLYG